MMEAWLIDPTALAMADDRPLALVDLDRIQSPPNLPPCPVIGLGNPTHPAARWVDAVVEPPVSVEQIIGSVLRHRQAAAALVQMLRATDALPVDRALVVESLCYAMLQGSAGHAAWLATRSMPAATPPGRVRLTRKDATLYVVLDRPWAYNAIDRTMRDALFEAFTIAALDPDIRRVAWRSSGRAFSVGADLAEFGTTRDPATAHHIRGTTLPAHPLSRCAGIVDVHVQGACVGSGLEMAAFAGGVTASPAAWFQLPELAMGVIPGAGGCVSVPRRIGRRRTALMILSGRRIDAATALRWGLIDAIMDEAPVDPGRADPD